MEPFPVSNAARDAEVSRSSGLFAFARRVLVATVVVASVALTLYLVWYAADLLLLVFAGVLVSVLLGGFSRFLREKTGLGRGLALAIVTLVLLSLGALGTWLFVGRIGQQVDELRRQLPQASEAVRQYAGQHDWVRNALDRLPNLDDWLSTRGGTIVSRITGLASTTLGLAVNLVLVVIIGLYLAAQPELYSRGIQHLLPMRSRQRAGEVLGAISGALWRWLAGRFGLMLLNGALTAAGLWLLDVRLFLTLGLLAGLLNFIPNFGPWIAAVPAVLVAFLDGPQRAWQVALLYLVLQGADGYVLTPLVDRRSVELPPVLTITAQVLLGAAFGFLGLLLASPLTAAAVILVRMLYVEDVLGDRAQPEGS